MDMDFSLFSQVLDKNQNDKNVSARFYDKAIKTERVSENGLPIFKDVTYVEIRLKDNNTEVFDQPASMDKIKRFPTEYALYKLAKEKHKQGIPLEQFAFMTAAEIATCKNRGVFTVEDLAGLSDEKIQQLNLQSEHELACLFLQNAKSNQGVAEFAAKEKQYEQKIAQLQDMVEQLNIQIKNLKAKTTRRKKGESK